MIIKGKLQAGLLEYYDCIINVRYGKINGLNLIDVSPLILTSYQIEVSTDYTFEKHYCPEKAPFKSNYFIRYKGGYKNQHIIFFKLNLLQYIRLKYAMEKWILQSEDMKKDILKYIIGGIIGYIGGLMIQEVKAYSKAPVSPPKTESQKSFEHK
ncbi:hypothetical protein [Flavobacterium restrictum]|uniref:Uncharacterized protein n=1 Tax=Flavobacterium restrictum TaxID=2594428 RepID=A0A553DMY0_9FLAO|nr:hypothetical protein [Flavobacterium restrictum]TRX34100.1 hypothetical protein FNW21_15925 [Flavobacterium restrictum]